MLSKADNEKLTRVGPGTPMGELFRRFWMPALLSEEIAERDGAPVRLRLLGEDLVAFRDTQGRVGIVDAYCAHRRAGLFFGRNEDCGLRCVYHGWKFDVDGICVDMPAEPQGMSAATKVRIKAYKTAERNGVIWVYMGAPEHEPALPDFEWSRLPERQHTSTKRLQQCNWAQAVEGGIDSSHISFLHSRSEKSGGPSNKYHASDKHPVFEVQETGYGLLIAARRNAEPGTYYWRVTQFLLPFYSMIPPVGDFAESSREPYDGHAWVPIDDENTWTWSFSASPARAYDDKELAFRGGRDGFWGPVDHEYKPLLNRDNDYQIDRVRQRAANFTGIDGIPNQDAAVQESMGPIVDRTKERLGASDRGVVQFRRLMLRLARELEEGKAPACAGDGSFYNVRSASLLLPDDMPVATGAAPLLAGAAP
ncbi:MAG: aromatic ring-hydroxylating dioxygenase subunit alpha [Rudaea sp.]|nr:MULTISPECIES: Rieske 2Fe-2S domain-containing protein [unclassified Rudaea]MBN8885684.1 aromatic ring-hydroxylating dioxygenase subunit alpha [Rudaea sp.]MBR0344463.1 aromatic ring-hydroxylating dioxygenase subunit alpha [Rudaea sp.]